MKKFLLILILLISGSYSIAATLSYSTYLGGANTDFCHDIYVNKNGEAFITGITYTNDFPTTVGSFDTLHNSVGNNDIFVTQLSVDGSSLNFSTFLGGAFDDRGYSIAVDTSENVLVTGKTSSPNFPQINAFSNINNGFETAFLTKLSGNGSILSYSTFVGEGGDRGIALNITESGNGILTGRTQSLYYPVTVGAYDNSYNGGTDIIVSKMTTDGALLVFSTYLGGSGWDGSYGNVLNANEDIFLIGETNSNNYPVQNPYDNSYNGGVDIFVTKISTDGSSLLYSTFLGGALDDRGYGITLNSNEDIFLTGETNSNDFPTQSAYDSLKDGYDDAFMTKISSDGSSLIYSTYFGGLYNDAGCGITLYEDNKVVITGNTSSNNFPMQNALFSNFNGNGDFFITQFDTSGSNLEFSTFLGGSGNDSQGFQGNPVAFDKCNLYFCGGVASSNFTVTNEAFDGTFNGIKDAIVVKLQFPNTLISKISNFEIEVSGSDIVLTWLEKQDATLYKIYRSTNLELTNSTQIGTFTSSGSPPTFIDIGAAQSAEKYFYFVTWEN
ncbi:MAG: hypothetical protein DWQ06_03275 [Calditrichaeota bacterium]|nr:MAG: hypothetical protein DWQ06_03275 [Calditrichota bacterium]